MLKNLLVFISHNAARFHRKFYFQILYFNWKATSKSFEFDLPNYFSKYNN